MSLAAMEAALKPKVLETLDLIARDYDKLAEMQDAGCRDAVGYQRFPPPKRPPIRSCGRKSCTLVNELHLHNNRIEALIDQLYGINKRIMRSTRAW
jgi:RNA polymerase primary sigma factor